MKTPRFTDSHRFPHGPYIDAKASSEPGYLAAKFARIIEQQKQDAAEKKEKMIPMRKTGTR